MEPTIQTPRQANFIDKFLDFIQQFLVTLLLHKAAYGFIKAHKPWKGMDRFGWILWAMVAAGALLSYQYFQGFYQSLQQLRTGTQPLSMSLASMFSLEKLQWAMDGSRKYLVMIVLELVVFYFIQKTLEIRIGRSPNLTTNAFINAEIRIFKVTILAWVLETIARILIVDVGLGILGADLLKKPAGFLIQCYFLGFALIDNYQECFDLGVKESEERCRKVAIGVAIALGLVAQLLMYIPGLGAIIATMLGAVAATLAMERFAPVGQEEHLAIVAAHEKKRKRADKVKRHSAQA